MGAVPVGERSRRTPWLPIGVCLACCLLILGTLLLADRPAWSTAAGWSTGSTNSFAPADGSAVFVRTDGSTGPDGGTGSGSTDVLGPPLTVAAGTVLIESARLPVVSAVQSVEQPLGHALLQALAGRLDVPIWRTTSRQVDPAAAAGQGSTARTEPTAFYRVDDGIALLASDDATGVRSFVPALSLLPAVPRPGASWSTDGTMTTGSGTAHYAGRFRVVSLAQNCATVNGQLTLTGTFRTSLELSQTWCPTSGIAAQTVRGEGGVATTRTVIPPGPGPATGPAAPGTPSPHAGGWQAHSITPVTVGVDGHTSPLQGTPAALAPVLTATGVLVRAGQQGRDLVLLAPRPSGDGSWPVRGRLHPGGTPTMLAAAGPMIIVGTTDRQLIGYDSRGIRRWQVGLDDVIAAPPIVVGSTLFTATVGGTVLAVDTGRGTVLWRHQVGDVVSTSPAAASGSIAVETASSTVIALDLKTGAERWQISRDSTGDLIGIGTTFIVSDGRAVHAYDASTGQHLWRRAVSSTVEQLLGLGSDVLVRAHDNTTVLDAGGGLRSSAQSYAAVVVDGTRWIGWRAGAADLYSTSTGRTVPTSYPLGQLSDVADPQLVNDGTSILIFSAGWSFAAVELPS